MIESAEQFAEAVDELRMDLARQGHRVETLVGRAFVSVFDRDADEAREARALDDEIDLHDLAIEARAVELLCEIAKRSITIEVRPIRGVLMAVKINNELERIADSGVAVAERVMALTDRQTRFPDTLRVMTNSVIGLLRDAVRCYSDRDAALAKVVLHSDTAVEQFKRAILRDAEQRVASGRMTVDLAFDLHEIASQCMTVADHCTNIAEQVIYAMTGAVVRHSEGAWREMPRD